MAQREVNEQIDETAEILAGHDEPDPELEARQSAMRQRIRDCDRRLARYRAALDHADGEVASITQWIAEVERERESLQVQLGQLVPAGKLTKSQTRVLVEALRDIVTVARADAEDRTELYQQLGVTLTYYPDGPVAVDALPRG